MSRDSIGKTFVVAGTLCVVCSVLVSSAAVGLKSIQEENKALDLQKNILIAAGLYSDDDPVDVRATFEDKIETRVVDLSSGEYVAADEVNPAAFDQRQAAKDPARSSKLDSAADLASIRRLETRSLVYLYREGDEVEQYILPIRGMGLWGTLYGFLAVDKDLQTVRGLTYYQHKETPGLGGEVDNPNWKKQWPGKKLFASGGEVALKVKKGRVDASIETEAAHQVDGLAGATITSNGVTNMMQFWLGESGFGPFLERLAQGAG